VPRAYRFQSSGAANTQLLHLLHWFISSKQTEFTQPYVHNSSMPPTSEARTVHDAEETRSSLTSSTGDCCAGEPFTLRSCSPRPSVGSRGSIYYDITEHIIIIVVSRCFTGRSDNTRSPAIRTPNRATQRVGLDIAWRDGVLVHPSPALNSLLLSSPSPSLVTDAALSPVLNSMLGGG
jgi:hypothetical protein